MGKALHEKLTKEANTIVGRANNLVQSVSESQCCDNATFLATHALWNSAKQLQLHLRDGVTIE